VPDRVLPPPANVSIVSFGRSSVGCKMHDPVGIEHGNAAGPYEFVYPAETAVSTASEATCVSEPSRSTKMPRTRGSRPPPWWSSRTTCPEVALIASAPRSSCASMWAFSLGELQADKPTRTTRLATLTTSTVRGSWKSAIQGLGTCHVDTPAHLPWPDGSSASASFRRELVSHAQLLQARRG